MDKSSLHPLSLSLFLLNTYTHAHSHTHYLYLSPSLFLTHTLSLSHTLCFLHKRRFDANDVVVVGSIIQLTSVYFVTKAKADAIWYANRTQSQKLLQTKKAGDMENGNVPPLT